MNTTFSASFTLMNDMHICFDAYSEHCCFCRAESLKGIFPNADDNEVLINNNPNEYERVTYFFHFSLDHIHSNQWGELVGVLTKEFHCLLTFDGWWDIYVPMQFVKQLNLTSNLW